MLSSAQLYARAGAFAALSAGALALAASYLYCPVGPGQPEADTRAGRSARTRTTSTSSRC
jgi:hypothetical protein